MKKWKSFRYIVFLCIGGMIFSTMMGYTSAIKEILFPDLLHQEKEDRFFLEKFAEELSANIQGEKNRIDGVIGIGEPDGIGEKDGAGETDPLGEDIGTEEGNDGQENGNSDSSVILGEAGENYFDDAVFIGDSRTVGLYEYGGLDSATFYCSSGMTLTGVFGPPNRHFKDGNWKENIADSLQENSFKKVYIMIGINDMGTGDLDYFTRHYEEMISQIRVWQPDAVIFVQSIMNVTEERSGKGDYINNEGINERNRILQEMDNGKDIFYLDINSAVCDENGNLNAEYTSDGVHLYAKYIYLWTDYLKSHAAIEK